MNRAYALHVSEPIKDSQHSWRVELLLDNERPYLLTLNSPIQVSPDVKRQ